MLARSSCWYAGGSSDTASGSSDFAREGGGGGRWRVRGKVKYRSPHHLTNHLFPLRICHLFCRVGSCGLLGVFVFALACVSLFLLALMFFVLLSLFVFACLAWFVRASICLCIVLALFQFVAYACVSGVPW